MQTLGLCLWVATTTSGWEKRLMDDDVPSCSASWRDAEDQLRAVREQFKSFLALLEQNNQVLKVIGDMEEKSQGEYLFDLNYIRTSLENVRQAVGRSD